MSDQFFPTSDPYGRSAAPPGWHQTDGTPGAPRAPYPPASHPQPGYPQPGYPQGPGSYPPAGGPPGYGPPGYGGGPAGPGGPGGPGGGPRRGLPGPLLAVIALVVVLAVAGAAFLVLNSDGDDDGEGAEVRTDLTLADLEPALLAAADMPDGFTATTWESDADSDDELDPQDLDASQACKDALTQFAISDAGPDEETGAEFDGDDGSSVTHTLSLGAADDPPLSEVRSAMDECGTFGYTDESGSGTITLESSDVEGIGDEALGVTMLVETVSEGTPVSVEMYGILVEHDGVHSSVRATGALPDVFGEDGSITSEPADRDLVRTLAETVDAKVAEVAG